jgi:hypothetical protein
MFLVANEFRVLVTNQLEVCGSRETKLEFSGHENKKLADKFYAMQRRGSSLFI